jgi:hypothetical protein
MLQKAIQAYRQEGIIGVIVRTMRLIRRKARPFTEPLVWSIGYAMNPWRVTGHPPRNSPGSSRVAYENILRDLALYGIAVDNFEIDWQAYQAYLQAADYPADYYPAWFLEKSLEHFISLQYLEIQADDILIDVASQFSPFPEITHKLYGCQVYHQDLGYEPGVHGNRIGGNAAQMPLQDNFATRISLHCSFEHFEGDADIRFIQESTRVLKHGGRVCIIPLYLNDEYCILTNPFADRSGMVVEPGASIRYVRNWLGGRHGRFYDVNHFVQRVLNTWKPNPFYLYFCEIPDNLIHQCYVRFALVLEKR